MSTLITNLGQTGAGSGERIEMRCALSRERETGGETEGGGRERRELLTIKQVD